MSNSPRVGMLQWDRFTAVWVTLVGLLVMAALVTGFVGGGQDAAMLPAYAQGDTVKDFVFNAYVAHLRGDLSRLQPMYAADTWAEMSEEDKNWGAFGLFAHSDLLGLRVLDTAEGPEGLQTRIASYHVRRTGPLGIQRLEIYTQLVRLAPAGDSWKLQQILPRYGY